ncbi:MAG: hypothetical protein ABJA64_02135 [Candidatus Saccharibacteria bacterium]
MTESNMGEVVHPKIKHKRIEFIDNEGEVKADRSTEESNDSEVLQGPLSVIRKLGRHPTTRLRYPRGEQEST